MLGVKVTLSEKKQKLKNRDQKANYYGANISLICLRVSATDALGCLHWLQTYICKDKNKMEVMESALHAHWPDGLCPHTRGHMTTFPRAEAVLRPALLLSTHFLNEMTLCSI